MRALGYRVHFRRPARTSRRSFRPRIPAVIVPCDATLPGDADGCKEEEERPARKTGGEESGRRGPV